MKPETDGIETASGFDFSLLFPSPPYIIPFPPIIGSSHPSSSSSSCLV